MTVWTVSLSLSLPSLVEVYLDALFFTSFNAHEYMLIHVNCHLRSAHPSHWSSICTLLKMQGCLNPNLGHIWTNLTFGLLFF